MTKEIFEAIKADFVNQYKPLLCEESMIDIEAAHDFHAFANVLKKYMAYNTYRPFPNVEWVRKWFSEDKTALHEEHIYLDELVVESDEENDTILCYGTCAGTAIFKKPCKHYIMLQDTSKLDLIANGQSVTIVKLKGEANIFVLYRDKTSIVKTRRYDTTDETKWV